MVVTWAYNAGTATVTASGAGTTNFAALVAADTAGGWGVFTADASGTQIRSAATQIVIGDGTNACAFVDTGKEVLFDYTGSGGPTYLIDVAANSSLVLGTLNDAATYDTCNGVDFILMSRYGISDLANRVSSTSAYYYSCSFSAIPQPGWGGGIMRIQGSANAGTTANVRVWNCVFDNQATLYACNEYAEFYNVIVSKTSGTSGLNSLRSSTINRITIYRCDYSITNTGFGVTSTYRNILSLNATSAFLRQESNNDCYLVNPDVDSRTFTFTGTGKVYWQYEFDLQTAAGATVTLTDKDGNVVFSVVADETSGEIDTQTVSRGYYAQSTGDTLQDYGPFTLTISKAGYLTYTHTGIVLDEKIDWRISLMSEADAAALFPSTGGRGQVVIKYVDREVIKKVEVPTKKEKYALQLCGVLIAQKENMRRQNGE